MGAEVCADAVPGLVVTDGAVRDDERAAVNVDTAAGSKSPSAARLAVSSLDVKILDVDVLQGEGAGT